MRNERKPEPDEKELRQKRKDTGKSITYPLISILRAISGGKTRVKTDRTSWINQFEGSAVFR
jgi:hypothetical protein